MGEEEGLLEIIMSKGLQRDGNKNLKKKGRFPRAPGFSDLGARDVSGTPSQDQQPWVLLTLTSQLCRLERASGPLPRTLPQGAGTFPGQAAGRAQGRGGLSPKRFILKAPCQAGLTLRPGVTASSPSPRLQPGARGPSSTFSSPAAGAEDVVMAFSRSETEDRRQ